MRSTYAPVEVYTGTGAVAAYSFSFKIEALAQLLVITTDASNVEQQRVRGTNVVFLSSVTFDSVNGGGTVNLAANLTNGHKIYLIQANDAPTQDSQFKSLQTFSLPALEAALDFLGGAIQRISWLAQRSMRLHDTFTGSFDMQLPRELTADATICVGPAGTSLVLGPTPAQLSSAATAATAAAASAAAALASQVAAAASATSTSTSATNANTSATTSANHATTAQRWASNAPGVTVVDVVSGIDSGEYSAKHYASLAAGHLAVTGTRAAPSAITAVGGISAPATQRALRFVEGDGGAVTVTANPRIAAGTTVGQELVLIGRSDTNTLTLANGNGLSLNGDIVLGEDDTLGLFWDGTNWSELYRRH